MRIIKKGQIPADKLYQFTCRECKTEFEFTKGEASVSYDQRDGDFLKVHCPLCQNLCYVNI